MDTLLLVTVSVVAVALVSLMIIGAVPDGLWGRLGGKKLIDVWLKKAVADLGGGDDLAGYHAYLKTLPSFRLADLHRALDALADDAKAVERLDSDHHETLAQILTGHFHNERNRPVRASGSVARAVAEGKDAFFPTDTFRVVRLGAEDAPSVFRLKFDSYTQSVRIEVGAISQDDAEAAMERLLSAASEVSVYRGKTLEVSFESDIRDEYGDAVQGEFVDLRFRPTYRIEEDEIILEPEKRALLDRLLVDFYARRAALRDLGLPSRRGVLFYGPPGTGKTHTCKYLAHRLDGVTTLVATGRTLLHARSICQIARMLQPALVVLEDVDLVYGQREENAYGVALGELMDELDGFARDDEILFVLTTNAIDRVEAAVKDRPGRISQCVLFGLPGPDLRQRYLTALLAPYDTSGLDLSEVVRMTDRTSQAFLKELVFRAVQIATEAEGASEPAAVRLGVDHVREAVDEMKAGAGREGAAILGFQVA
ncbi:MAG: ATP-binding protein [Bacteroidota bacterium]